MSSDYDATEFIDGDLHARPSPHPAPAPGNGVRAPTREEVDAKVAETHQKLLELKRAQEELERERAGLEETRRRQMEVQAGRQEMIQNLTRGLGLLEEAEFGARREAEQTSKSVAELREALEKVQAIHEDTWTESNFSVELTRGLTILETARMEWNSARLKHAVLAAPAEEHKLEEPHAAPVSLMQSHSFGELCRLGFALTWPVALAVIIGVAACLAFFMRR